jgi:hypothetical protein
MSDTDLLLGAGWVLGGAVLGFGVSPWARAGIAHSIAAVISAAGKQAVKKQQPTAFIPASNTAYNCSEIERGAQLQVTGKSAAENDDGCSGDRLFTRSAPRPAPANRAYA